MIHARHRLLAAAAPLLLLGCGRKGESGVRGPEQASRASAASATSTTVPAAVAADASRPNAVLDPATFTDPATRAAYAAAAKYAHVLEGIYCYCHCKENIGHRALVQCYESDHASRCDICQNEAIVAARMTAEGRSVAEIQAAIDAYYKG